MPYGQRAVPEVAPVTPEVITPQTPLPEGQFVRVTIKEPGKRQTSFWAKVDTRGKWANIYIPVNKEGVDLSREVAGEYILPKDLIQHSLIVKEELAEINLSYGTLEVLKPVPKVAIPKAESGSPSYLKEPFIKVGDRVRYISEFKGRIGTWPEGVWLEKGIEGTVTEYHPPEPEIVAGGKRFEAVPAWAIAKFDNGASTAIDPEDEGKRWERARDATSTSPHPVVLERYPLGEVPEKIPIGGLDVPIPPLRGTELPPKKPRVVAENAVLRTDEKFDSSVKHLGYESVNLSQEELEALDKPIPTDVEIINDSQKRLRSTEVVTDEKLNSRQLSHLKLARVIAKDIFHTPGSIYAAIIPPASERVRTAGLYGTTTKIIYINLDQLSSGRNMIDTLVHELGHHQQYRQTNKAEDLSPEHAEAMTLVASRVVDDVSRGKFDKLLKEISW